MTQFGYGRRTCQGQTVTEADLIAGIGAVAWLFDIQKEPKESSARSIMLNEKASISEEEMLTGLSEHSSDDEEDLPCNPSGPWPLPQIEELRNNTVRKIRQKREQAQKKSKEDETLIFSTLLIAKPLPFKFRLAVRDEKRAQLVQCLFEDKIAQGDFAGPKEYCQLIKEVRWSLN